ncbi:hypothetical protein Rs2_16013 [Raphanus sativus]|nr:hypothetical protein Rs2_16013 [Raphanus sativus]
MSRKDAQKNNKKYRHVSQSKEAPATQSEPPSEIVHVPSVAGSEVIVIATGSSKLPPALPPPSPSLRLSNHFSALACPPSNSLPSNPFITPVPATRPSLKRSRSFPTLSPPNPLNTNPNPFAPLLLFDSSSSHKIDPLAPSSSLQLAFLSGTQDHSILSEDPPPISQ